MTNISKIKRFDVEVENGKAYLVGNPDGKYCLFADVEAAQPAGEAVSAQCRFEGEEWNPCTIEHHLLVQAHPKEWPHYETRVLYTAQPAQVPDVRLVDALKRIKKTTMRQRLHGSDTLRDWQRAATEAESEAESALATLAAAPQPDGGQS